MTRDPKNYGDFDILGYHYPLPLGGGGSRTKEHILMKGTILFAQKGYASVSMRDLAEVTGIKPASLYNHFSSKEALWEAVVDHAVDLYRLYFKRLGETLSKARTFEQVLDIMFQEPETFTNIFSCLAFGLIQAEQFRDERAGAVFNGTFLEYSINFIKGWFDRCVEQGLVRSFDTWTVAAFLMNSVLVAIELKVQEVMGRPIAHSPGEMIKSLHRFILDVTAKH
ncbi:MAG: TetR/AcrR family transcriptional regulator [Candidatus Adiutrix sp.]|nr:TetR/AcrR family transcriptional regulator [Candidatus Adiutrix sp.]